MQTTNALTVAVCIGVVVVGTRGWQGASEVGKSLLGIALHYLEVGSKGAVSIGKVGSGSSALSGRGAATGGTWRQASGGELQAYSSLGSSLCTVVLGEVAIVRVLLVLLLLSPTWDCCCYNTGPVGCK